MNGGSTPECRYILVGLYIDRNVTSMSSKQTLLIFPQLYKSLCSVGYGSVDIGLLFPYSIDSFM
jgi:hypothetical protein